MPTTSTVLAIPIPAGTDPDDIPSIIAAVAARLDAIAVSRAGGSTIAASGPGVRPLVLKLAAGQTANGLEVRASDDTVLTRVNAAGSIVATNTAPGTENSLGGPTLSGARLALHTGNPLALGLVVRGYANQGANLGELQNSDGTVETAFGGSGSRPNSGDSSVVVNITGVGLRRILVGAPDSAGAGFRTLRIAN